MKNNEDYLKNWTIGSPTHIQRDEGCQAIEENYWQIWAKGPHGEAVYAREDSPKEVMVAIKNNIHEYLMNLKNNESEEQLICPECGNPMYYTGVAFYTSPLQYEHKCVNGHDQKSLKEYKNSETVRLAKLVADIPPLPNDEESIKQWAETLAADISKYKD